MLEEIGLLVKMYRKQLFNCKTSQYFTSIYKFTILIQKKYKYVKKITLKSFSLPSLLKNGRTLTQFNNNIVTLSKQRKTFQLLRKQNKTCFQNIKNYLHE